MGERKSQNKWYPPDLDPSRTSLNAHYNRRPAGMTDREGHQTVRFALPFACRCLHCGVILGVGKRFNALKKPAGFYLTIAKWSFTFRCPQCGASDLVIQTDPEKSAFTCTSGVRAQYGDALRPGGQTLADTAPTGDLPVLRRPSDAEKQEREQDPMARLEAETQDRQRAQDQRELLTQLQSYQDEVWQDGSWAVNKQMRQQRRQERQERVGLAQEAEGRGLRIPLLHRSAGDATLASRLVLGRTVRREISKTASVFGRATQLRPGQARGLKKEG